MQDLGSWNIRETQWARQVTPPIQGQGEGSDPTTLVRCGERVAE